jgi:hypothetical protein
MNTDRHRSENQFELILLIQSVVYPRQFVAVFNREVGIHD